METAIMIFITFGFPLIVIAMIIVFARVTQREVGGKDKLLQDQDLLINILEKLVATKDNIIEKLKF
jgi:hypothetical protein